jgi:galactofuranosylgalactofuranosylrhamnosyl-N-acetylglucosaminyl-diphospho-decaprenol beta-1,5/1,6-galactofuranosyltransferase
LVQRKRADEWDLWTTPVDRGTVTLPKSADHWWGLMDYPDAAVVTIDGTKAVLRRRDPKAAKDLTRQSWRLGRDILRRYRELVVQYAGVRETAASPEAWEKQWTR